MKNEDETAKVPWVAELCTRTEMSPKLVLPLTRFYGMFDTRELVGLRVTVARGNGRAEFVQIFGDCLVAEDLVTLPDGSECLMTDLAEAIKAGEKESTK